MSFTPRDVPRSPGSGARLFEVRLSGRGVLLLAVIAAALALLSLGLDVLDQVLYVDFRGLASLQGYFGLDAEGNVPAWFRSGLLLVCGLVLWTIADDVRAAGARHVVSWRALSVIFVYLSVDELVAFHERADEPLHRMLHTSGALLWAWVLLAGPLVVVFALAYLPFLLSLPSATRNGLLLAGAVYVGGAIGVEMLGSYLFSTLGPGSLLYQLSTIGEESLEMAGLLVALATLGRHAATIRDRAGADALDLTAGAGQPVA